MSVRNECNKYKIRGYSFAFSGVVALAEDEELPRDVTLEKEFSLQPPAQTTLY